MHIGQPFSSWKPPGAEARFASNRADSLAGRQHRYRYEPKFDPYSRPHDPTIEDLLRYTESVRFRRKFKGVIDRAEGYLNKLSPADIQNGAVVLDLDETLLDNRDYYRKHKVFKQEMWDQWIDTADAKALPETQAFIDSLRERKIPFYFLSSRKESQRGATEANLKKLGMTDQAGIILKPDDSEETTSVFKSNARVKIEADSGRKIIATMGDQETDLKGKALGRAFKLPNPLYTIPDKPKPVKITQLDLPELEDWLFASWVA
jgi:hypothetical protein